MKPIEAFNAMMSGDLVRVVSYLNLEVESNVFKIHSCEEGCVNLYHIETTDVFYDIPYNAIKL